MEIAGTPSTSNGPSHRILPCCCRTRSSSLCKLVEHRVFAERVSNVHFGPNLARGPLSALSPLYHNRCIWAILSNSLLTGSAKEFAAQKHLPPQVFRTDNFVSEREKTVFDCFGSLWGTGYLPAQSFRLWWALP